MPVNGIRCPTCLCVFEWPDAYQAELYEYDAGDPRNPRYVPVDPDVHDAFRADRSDGQQIRFRSWLAKKYIKCENTYGGGKGDHYLIYPYGWYGDPIMIGVVGRTAVGKSHLLAAMIGQLVEHHGLEDLGLTVLPVDRVQHQKYAAENVAPLLDDSAVLLPTKPTNEAAMFVDAFIVANRRTGRRRTVAFFDISGEDFVQGSRSADFVDAATALLFVVDPQMSGLLGNGGRETGDRAFGAVLERMVLAGRHEPDSGLLDVDVAVVVNKADQIRFEPPARHWYGRQRPAGRVNADDILMESTDVYALLHSRSAKSWLAPVRRCRRATLHFASATGCERAPEAPPGDEPTRFRRKVRPRRVLEPLVALFVMTGVLGEGVVEGRQTRQVGI